MGQLFVDVVFDLPLKKTFTYLVPENLRLDIRIGQRVVAPFKNNNLTGFVFAFNSAVNKKILSKIKPLEKILDPVPLLTPEHIDLAKWMQDYYFSSLGEALSMMFPSSYEGNPVVEKSQKNNIITDENLHKLTKFQQKNYDEIAFFLKNNKNASFLLHGVTGSGKTEIYLHLIKEAYLKGKSAIFLLPEIALTTQVVQYFFRVLPESSVAILHSRMTKKQKFLEWQRILKGEKQIVIGPRSALFAPVKNLGIIVVDEEHSSSYKEHARPKYNARQVAYYRAKQNKAVLVLGSATPSLESYYMAKNKKGSFKLLTLPNRINNSPLPQIRILKNNSFQNLLHPDLIKAIQEKLRKKEQIILFYNQRGFSNFYYCQDCGHIFKCPHCSVSLTMHRKEGKDTLQCHFCGYTEKKVSRCPECDSIKLSPVGAGTQKIELLLQQYFPEAKIQRYDLDTTKRKGSSEKIYNSFLEQKIDILVGTQMVAKGLHFPNVTLVGVVGFDNMVNLPDFRSFENTFSMLLQVAGRTGRADKTGEVIIQTIDENHPLVPYIRKQDYVYFYEREIQNREMLKYPPFARLIRILVRALDEEKGRKTIQSIKKYLLKEQVKAQILGPVAAPYAKLHNQFRFHLIMKINKRETSIQKTLNGIPQHFGTPHVSIDLEPDPISLL